MPAYHPQRIEPKWQAYWERNKTFRAADLVPDKPKLYVLDMFPYPSGAGLHVGHPEGYTATDIVCRYKRMRGYNVLHPMGWDAFGLPAEQYAVQTNTHPRITTQQNIDNFRRQIKSLGFSYDWDREIDTTDPDYYRWTQWIFLQLFDTWYDPDFEWTDAPADAIARARGGRSPSCRSRPGTRRPRRLPRLEAAGLPRRGPRQLVPRAGHGPGQRGGHRRQERARRASRRPDAAEAMDAPDHRLRRRLVEDLELVDWPRADQGDAAQLDRPERRGRGRLLVGDDSGLEATGDGWPDSRADVIRVFTTRPDTLFGATYMVLAPEHPLVDRLTTPEQRDAVDAYRESAAARATSTAPTWPRPRPASSPAATPSTRSTASTIPIWIADYVLMGYGTGAIMAVPGHDERDFEFAKAFGLPIVRVVAPSARPGRRPCPHAEAEPGVAVNSRERSDHARRPAHRRGQGRHHRLARRTRAWARRRSTTSSATGSSAASATGASRSRSCSTTRTASAPVPESRSAGPAARTRRLQPVRQARAAAGQGDRVGPLLGQGSAARPTRCPSGPARAGTYLRYLDPKNDRASLGPGARNVLDAGRPLRRRRRARGAAPALQPVLAQGPLRPRPVSTPEPFQRLVNQGMILGETEYTGYRDESGRWASSAAVEPIDHGGFEAVIDGKRTPVQAVKLRDDQVIKKGEGFVLAEDPEVRIDARAHKMSKSRGNVINPDTVVKEYGADSLRLYEMFMGPLEAVKPWSMKGVEGVYRFLGRGLADDRRCRGRRAPARPTVKDVAAHARQAKVVARTVAAVTDDLEALRFNTAISRLMEFTNAFTARRSGRRRRWRPSRSCLLRWPRTSPRSSGRSSATSKTLAYEPWPTSTRAPEGRRGRGPGPGQRQAPGPRRRPRRRRRRGHRGRRAGRRADRRRCSTARRSARSSSSRASWSTSWSDERTAGERGSGMTRSRYIVGIDLGTTNCAVGVRRHEGPRAALGRYPAVRGAATRRGRRDGAAADAALVPLPARRRTTFRPGRPGCPGTRMPTGSSASSRGSRGRGSRATWSPAPRAGSATPGSTARPTILPWGAPPERGRSRRSRRRPTSSRHIRDAWNAPFARDDEAHRLEKQEVVLTVPASFDEAARELTLDAREGRGAGDDHAPGGAAGGVLLLDRLPPGRLAARGPRRRADPGLRHRRRDDRLQPDHRRRDPDGPGFRRVAVGDHLMLGGDNIDLALAHRVEKKLGGARLDAEQWSAPAVRLPDRQGKTARRRPGRALAGDDRRPGLEDHRRQHPVGADAGRGRVEVVLDGFFPRARPRRGARRGAQARAPGVRPAVRRRPGRSRGTWARSSAATAPRRSARARHELGDDRPARPDAILFNGGALTPAIVRDRVVEVVTVLVRGRPGPPYAPRVLANASLDLAVAYGAAYYGVVRRGGGIRIGGGTARSFYVGFEAGPADRPWLCVVPRDAQEGDEIAIEHRDFDLLMGQPVAFPLASSSVRPDDRPGDLVAADPDSIRELPPLQSRDARSAARPRPSGSRCGWRRGSPRSARSSSGASRGPTTAAGGFRSSSAGRAASRRRAGAVTGSEADRRRASSSRSSTPAIAAIRTAFGRGAAPPRSRARRG